MNKSIKCVRPIIRPRLQELLPLGRASRAANCEYENQTNVHSEHEECTEILHSNTCIITNPVPCLLAGATLTATPNTAVTIVRAFNGY
jgi:hypothetical protein